MKTYQFSVRLERGAQGGLYYIRIPASVSKAIGKRGNVPIVAEVNGVATVRASLVPIGGGRHRLGLNAKARQTAIVDEGARIAIRMVVDENPVADPLPKDFAAALRELGVLASFQRLPVGKQNHIIAWIEEAARDETRAKRIARAVEEALRAAEKESDRVASKKVRMRVR